MYTHDQNMLDNARIFCAEIYEHIIGNFGMSDLISATCHPCSRGGWKVGYTYSGRYCVKFMIVKNSTGTAVDTYKLYTNLSIESVRKYYTKKILPILENRYSAIQALNIYRKSGLIPKHIAKKHGRYLREKYKNWMKSRDALIECNSIYSSYIRNYAKCPKCGNKFKATETISGYICDSCGAEWVDFSPLNPHWETFDPRAEL